MAEIPSSQYWCYHCDKRVSIETLTDLPDIICFECKNGFVESIPQPASPSPSPPPPPPPPPPPSITNQQPYFSNHFLQILRLIAESAHDDDNPPPSPPPAPADSNDFLRIQLDGWNNDRDDDDDEEEEDEINFGNDPLENEEQDIDSRRRRHDLLRLRMRDFAYRSNPNRLMDWSGILMGLQSHTMEFRFQMPEYYVGNPEDYVDAAGYEALLQRLADTDGGRRGPPPASKSAVSGLKTVVITNLEQEGVGCCAICKETLTLGEEAKKLPCGHGYHGDCIVTWLGSRNTCPVCRFELPTEDPDYEDQRNKRSSMGPSSSHGGSSSSGPNNTTSP